ncbi:MAG: DoxX family protein [Deltaproteobacteria bacterium]|nr:DoxX family protein [Deltaproteobacteria bacterium]
MIARDSKIGELAAGLLNCLNRLEWLPILLVRLSVGLLFFESGRGKLFVKLEELGEFFVKLGIPFPHFNAVFVSTVEFVGGICLILGLATRIFSAQLFFVMLVAILTSEIKKVSTLGDFLYLPEVSLLVIFVWLVFSGPGKISIDHLLSRKLGLEGQ